MGHVTPQSFRRQSRNHARDTPAAPPDSSDVRHNTGADAVQPALQPAPPIKSVQPALQPAPPSAPALEAEPAHETPGWLDEALARHRARAQMQRTPEVDVEG